MTYNSDIFYLRHEIERQRFRRTMFWNGLVTALAIIVIGAIVYADGAVKGARICHDAPASQACQTLIK